MFRSFAVIVDAVVAAEVCFSALVTLVVAVTGTNAEIANAEKHKARIQTMRSANRFIS